MNEEVCLVPERRVALTLLLAAAANPARAQQRTVDELYGELNSRTFPAFERFVSQRLDRVIGLKIRAEPSDDRSGLSISASGGQFVAYSTRVAMSEIVANAGFTWQHGAYLFDGFFIVKSGGMHQGIVSYGLQPVAEATVRLGRGVVVRRVDLR